MLYIGYFLFLKKCAFTFCFVIEFSQIFCFLCAFERFIYIFLSKFHTSRMNLKVFLILGFSRKKNSWSTFNNTTLFNKLPSRKTCSKNPRTLTRARKPGPRSSGIPTTTTSTHPAMTSASATRRNPCSSSPIRTSGARAFGRRVTPSVTGARAGVRCSAATPTTSPPPCTIGTVTTRKNQWRRPTAATSGARSGTLASGARYVPNEAWEGFMSVRCACFNSLCG